MGRANFESMQSFLCYDEDFPGMREISGLGTLQLHPYHLLGLISARQGWITFNVRNVVTFGAEFSRICRRPF